MKLDRTLVTHVTEQTEAEFLRLLEFERSRGDENLTVSTLLARLIGAYISGHKRDYEALKTAFEQNQENGKN